MVILSGCLLDLCFKPTHGVTFALLHNLPRGSQVIEYYILSTYIVIRLFDILNALVF